MSILTIHTNEWQPMLKPQFISELADSTVGYCGADLKGLCTEAALQALRRKYPQIYQTSDKLVLDVSKLNVSASDFHNALKTIVPTAQRSDSSVARCLSETIQPLLISQLHSLLLLVGFIFPSSWKAVEKAQKNLQSLLGGEDKVGREVVEVCGSEEHGGREGDAPRLSGLGSSLSGTRMEKIGNASRTLVMSLRQEGSLAETGANLSTLISSKEGELQCFNQNTVNPHAFKPSLGGVFLGSRFSLGQNQFSQLYLSQQPASLGEIYFDTQETVLEGCESEIHVSILQEHQESSKVAHSVRNGSQEEISPLCSSPAFLSFSAQPHALPTSHRPRIIICGKAGMGQTTHLAPALLHALEEIPVKILDLSALFAVSTKTPEEACTQV